MARSRLRRAVALLAAVILFCAGFLMLKRHVLDAEGMLACSLFIALLGGVIASFSGGLAALAAKCSGGPFWLVVASLPLLVPSPSDSTSRPARWGWHRILGTS